jgi:hypothetical protein
MLTKILFTAAIILACYLYLRYKKNKQLSATKGDVVTKQTAKISVPGQLKCLAAGILLITVCSAAGFLFVSD